MTHTNSFMLQLSFNVRPLLQSLFRRFGLFDAIARFIPVFSVL